MIYTQARRRAMNAAVRNMYPDIRFHESSNGIPVMECDTLPRGAVRIEDAFELMSRVNEHCVRKDGMGNDMTDYGKALPVFILSFELTGNHSQNKRTYYRVNYVSPSEKSQETAAGYIKDGKLFAVIK